MMSYVMGALIALGFLFSLFLGRMNELSGAVLESGVSAVKLCIELCGTLALWSGVMRIAERAGLCEKISGAMAPLTDRLFPGLRGKSPHAIASITLNMTANLLGLGAAATPMALDAMAELDRLNDGARTASGDMIVFVALNTASFQILPTTVATIRRLAGCENPMDIIPCVWISSAVSVSVAVGSALLLNKRRAVGR
ncbi:MAG: nucleoside recognition domain-containing protein [Oscillospiraceae bacterium]|nr:nucleoside recognition domain-containing protein [Oscillospiraceae bacterium]